MENKKIVPVWLSTVLLILSVSGIVYYFYDAFRIISRAGFTSTIVMYAFSVVGLTLAVIYFLYGCKKNASDIFRAFCIVMTVGFMVTDYIFAPYLVRIDIVNTVLFFDLLIQSGIWFVLTIAKDLGKKKSITLCSILIALQVLCTALMSSFGTYMMIGSAVVIVTYAITYIMFRAKYLDKDARGTT